MTKLEKLKVAWDAEEAWRDAGAEAVHKAAVDEAYDEAHNALVAYKAERNKIQEERAKMTKLEELKAAYEAAYDATYAAAWAAEKAYYDELKKTQEEKSDE